MTRWHQILHFTIIVTTMRCDDIEKRRCFIFMAASHLLLSSDVQNRQSSAQPSKNIVSPKFLSVQSKLVGRHRFLTAALGTEEDAVLLYKIEFHISQQRMTLRRYPQDPATVLVAFLVRSNYTTYQVAKHLIIKRSFECCICRWVFVHPVIN